MKKRLIITLLTLAASHQVFAGNNYHEAQQKRLAQMTKALNLSEQQRKNINAIEKKYAPERQALQKEIKALRHTIRSEINAELTAEQRKKWEQQQAKRKHKKHNND